MTLAAIHRDLEKAANPKIEAILLQFFKTGPREYGEGDRFRGIKVPTLRRLSIIHQNIPLSSCIQLLRSPWHEDRLLALFILIRHFSKATPSSQQTIVHLYLRHTRYINNWDLVDLSAPNILGAWIATRPRSILYQLVKSKSLWERRIAILATLSLIRQNQFSDTLRIAQKLLRDPEDLIHKATGWMLREVGKRDLPAEKRFLDKHARHMPRTMLRYAIERFPERVRKHYMQVPT